MFTIEWNVLPWKFCIPALSYIILQMFSAKLSNVSSLFSLYYFSLSGLNLTNQIMTSFLDEKKSFLKLLQRTSVDVWFSINLEANSHFWTLHFALRVSQPGERSIPESEVSAKMKMICTNCYLYKCLDFVYWV